MHGSEGLSCCPPHPPCSCCPLPWVFPEKTALEGGAGTCHWASRWEGVAQSTVGKVGAGEDPDSGRGGRLPHLLLEEQSSHPVFWRA